MTGGKANHHIGNQIYRKVVNEMKERYRNTEDKDEKTDISRSIVEQVLVYGGRFVKKDSATGKFYVLTKTEARTKTSQALRENRADSKCAASSKYLSDSDEACSRNGSDSEEEESPSAGTLKLDRDSLDCCRALVSLSKVSESLVAPASATSSGAVFSSTRLAQLECRVATS